MRQTNSVAYNIKLMIVHRSLVPVLTMANGIASLLLRRNSWLEILLFPVLSLYSFLILTTCPTQNLPTPGKFHIQSFSSITNHLKTLL